MISWITSLKVIHAENASFQLDLDRNLLKGSTHIYDTRRNETPEELCKKIHGKSSPGQAAPVAICEGYSGIQIGAAVAGDVDA